MLWSGYLLHCLEDHQYYVNEEQGLFLMGKLCCALNQKPASLYKNKEVKILQIYFYNQWIQKALPRLVHFTAFSPIWNLGIYSDKTVYYTYYNVLYEMNYLDWNKNHLWKVCYKHKTTVKDWKICHKKCCNCSILEDKTYHWQYEALQQMFPLQKEWFVSCNSKKKIWGKNSIVAHILEKIEQNFEISEDNFFIEAMTQLWLSELSLQPKYKDMHSNTLETKSPQTSQGHA